MTQHEPYNVRRDPHDHGAPRKRIERPKPPKPAKGTPEARRRLIRRAITGVAGCLAFLVLAGAGAAWWFYDKLNSNIKSQDFAGALGTDRPPATDATNILLIGSDSRQGDNARYGGDTGDTQRSDTTILLHIPQGRKSATAVSIPRDTMVNVPSCPAYGTRTTPSRAYFGMFNSAMETGGTTCTVKTVEQLTGVRIDHQITVDFTGFKNIVNALGGVPMHIAQPIHDKDAQLDLPAGDIVLNGDQALGFVRVRHSIGDGSDIQRIQRQQDFLKALIAKVKSEDLLTSPTELYSVLNAATKALTTDPGLASLGSLYDLMTSLKGIPTAQVDFRTVPITTYRPDPNRVALQQPDAANLFTALRDGVPLPTATSSASPSSAAR